MEIKSILDLKNKELKSGERHIFWGNLERRITCEIKIKLKLSQILKRKRPLLKLRDITDMTDKNFHQRFQKCVKKIGFQEN
ncbi:hypothetical protein BpHYR1_041592 [Brachionus plicatilis]|uniref:Uncharacterized protein n=1 Tax=Brachionus plicatilis TaxID=10195 RepID=A0A3M7SR64_BRAPC|nr:hypothetical protein BpHYR1_041592 [Brachionus plicatilis]